MPTGTVTLGICRRRLRAKLATYITAGWSARPLWDYNRLIDPEGVPNRHFASESWVYGWQGTFPRWDSGARYLSKNGSPHDPYIGVDLYYQPGYVRWPVGGLTNWDPWTVTVLNDPKARVKALLDSVEYEYGGRVKAVFETSSGRIRTTPIPVQPYGLPDDYLGGTYPINDPYGFGNVPAYRFSITGWGSLNEPWMLKTGSSETYVEDQRVTVDGLNRTYKYVHTYAVPPNAIRRKNGHFPSCSTYVGCQPLAFNNQPNPVVCSENGFKILSDSDHITRPGPGWMPSTPDLRSYPTGPGVWLTWYTDEPYCSFQVERSTNAGNTWDTIAVDPVQGRLPSTNPAEADWQREVFPAIFHGWYNPNAQLWGFSYYDACLGLSGTVQHRIRAVAQNALRLAAVSYAVTNRLGDPLSLPLPYPPT